MILTSYRSLYNKLKTNLQSSIVDSNGLQSHQQNGIEVVSGKWNENHLKQIAHANTTINRFLSAFIDHVNDGNFDKNNGKLNNIILNLCFNRVSKISITRYKRKQSWNAFSILNSTRMSMRVRNPIHFVCKHIGYLSFLSKF